MMLAVSTLVGHGSSLHHDQPFFFLKGRKLQNLVISRTDRPTHPSNKNERRRRNSRKQSEDATFVSKRFSSGKNEEFLSDRISSVDDSVTGNVQVASPSRAAVLQACTITSVLLLAVGFALRQAAHLAYVNGWPVLDPAEVSFDFEVWHLELIIGLVALISSSRYVLLRTWSDFAESSEAANRQILSSLEPLDYVTVAFLPGISEELLFRGALMPLVGLNWLSALITGAVFGVLHFGSGRRYSFALWATFVGFAYGLATVASSSIIVPMASHAINNLIGGLLWRFAHRSQEISG